MRTAVGVLVAATVFSTGIALASVQPAVADTAANSKDYRTSFETGDTAGVVQVPSSAGKTPVRATTDAVGLTSGGLITKFGTPGSSEISATVDGLLAKKNTGFTGKGALRYEGVEAGGAASSSGRNLIVDIAKTSASITVPPIEVTSSTKLSYDIFPRSTTDVAAIDIYHSTFVSLDLHFTDGKYLSELSPLDQHGIALTARGQGEGKILYVDQWNAVRANIGSVAKGRFIDQVLLKFDAPASVKDRKISGWIDNLSIVGSPASTPAATDLALVDTRRGTNSSKDFSRGNTLPITALPNGFSFLAPMTTTDKNSVYSYQANNNDNGLPTLQGMGISHQPSIWIGERNSVNFMPSISATPIWSSTGRALEFSHADEVAQPDLYSVKFTNQVTAKMTPTEHGGMFNYAFPAGSASRSLILDSVTNDFNYVVSQSTGEFSGWVQNPLEPVKGTSAGVSRMFIYGKFSEPPVTVTKDTALRDTSSPDLEKSTTDTLKGPSNALFVSFASSAITMKISTSFISLAQAKNNDGFDFPATKKAGTSTAVAATFDSVQAVATKAWKERLAVISVQGESDYQRSTLYYSLYRLNLYPNSQFENTGTASAPDYKYASPVSESTAESKKAGDANFATVSRANIKSGKIYVNNGFWDTYRTVWPAYSLLYPKIAAELVDGFVQLYNDGGWIPRWSAPGYSDIMTGTSSDVAFAGAYLRGVKLSDPLATYQAAVKNATVVSADHAVGRKGLTTSIFTGYPNESATAADETDELVHESVSWALEGAINDDAIANMGAKLLTDTTLNPALTAEQKAQIEEESVYFADKAKSYSTLFAKDLGNSSSPGFFAARTNGKFPTSLSPEVWGSPYTEGNAWTVAFSVPQDGQGLANLYGGRDQLAKKLDSYLATPVQATSEFEGSYGDVIHEMKESAAVRMGQLGMSNQPSHHAPYMYNYVGLPSKTADLVREVEQRLFVGGEIGQGMSGDDDNGEMASWYVLSSLGIYPLQSGSSSWTIGSPLFSEAKVTPLGASHSLTISAKDNSAANKYVQKLTLGHADGNTSIDSTSTVVDHKDLIDPKGNTTLAFTMGNKPSAWGTAVGDAPPSTTVGTDLPSSSTDITTAATLRLANGTEVPNLSDNNSSTVSSPLKTAEQPLTWTSSNSETQPEVRTYTLTSANDASKILDPTGWILSGSKDGKTWTDIDTRTDQKWAYRQQTKVYRVKDPGEYKQYKFVFKSSSDTYTLSEVELRVNPAKVTAEASNPSTFQAGGLTLKNGVAGTEFGMLDNGNLQAKNGATGAILFQSDTAIKAKSGSYAKFAKCNLAVYAADGTLLWETGDVESTHKHCVLRLTDAGHLQLADQLGIVLWSEKVTREVASSAAAQTTLGIPKFTTSELAIVRMGFQYSHFVKATAPYAAPTYSVAVPSTLPSGLSLNSATGEISGVPTGIGPLGTVRITATSANSSISKSTTATFSYTSALPLTSLTIPATLKSGEYILDGRGNKLEMTANGALTVSGSGTAFTSGTSTPGSKAVFASDCTIKVLSATDKVLWSAGTYSKTSACSAGTIGFNVSGNVVQKTANGIVWRWNSGKD